MSEQRPAAAPRHYAVWLVLLAAAGSFALIGGTRQTMALFLSPLNTATGLGLANISLAFAFGQLWWGLAQPFAGALVLVFAAVMGLTFLSTVPPTVGLVVKFFGPANMATLFGIVMLSHQVGGFLGAWLGGKVFDATDSYDLIWIIDILLAVGAALVHLPIQEARLKPHTA